MPQGVWPNDSLPGLASRRDALRQAASIPGADPEALLDAALTELDAAIDVLAIPDGDNGTRGEAGPEGLPEAVRAERRLLHASFQEAPVPLLLLESDGTIRRANDKAAELLGSPRGYATGKALSAFVDLAFRAAVQSQLAAVARTGEPRQTDCRLITLNGPADGVLAASAVEVPGGRPLLVVSIMSAGGPRAPETGDADKQGDVGIIAADRSIRALTRRMDTVTAVTRVLLDNSMFSEAVTVQRCARLLAGELADWVIVDVERGGQLRRQFAAGPRDRRAEDLARVVRSVDPEPSSLPWQVHESRKPVLLAHAHDPALLDTDPDGKPLLMLLGATSVMAVPISEGEVNYGTLTLARSAGAGPFGVADLALAEELGQHLAISIRVDRMFRHRSEVAETLQASLLPSRLPEVPGVEIAAAYVGATQWQEVSGDFYDVFRTRDGWAVAIGDVCGKGQEAAAMTAAARHAIRSLSHVYRRPADVLAAANEVLVAGDYGERFVTVKLGFLQQRGQRMRVRLGSAGHPGPAVVRADGRVEIPEGDGLPLGLFGGAELSGSVLELREGDLLFFYTDGVTEARSADAEMELFEDRLADSLAAGAGRSAAETVRAVQELVTEFSRGELRDDVTILAIRVAPAA